MSSPKKIPLPKALAWIVFSTLFFSGGAFYLTRTLSHARQKKVYALENQIQLIIQKGELKTIHLAELMGLSKNRPTSIYHFNAQEAEKKLLACPLISEARVKAVKPRAVYVDYKLRQPLARLYDYDNTALDKEGHLFPLFPFFSPRKLPEIYLGLTPFEADYYPAQSFWEEPLSGELFDLALHLLVHLTPLSEEHNFEIKRIDVANALATSLGRREIVLMIDDHILRFNPKTFKGQFANYLALRPRLAIGAQVIDLRLESLAYIDDGPAS